MLLATATNLAWCLKDIHLCVFQIIQMVNENKKKNIQSNKSKSMDSKNKSYSDVPADAVYYDSDDDILDPKTEIHLVTIKSDETECSNFFDSQTEEHPNVPISTWHTPQKPAGNILFTWVPESKIRIYELSISYCFGLSEVRVLPG